MPAPHASDEQNPRPSANGASDELSLNQLRAAHGRRVSQQLLAERITQLLLEASDAKYDVESCEKLIHTAVDALCEGLGADSVYMLELVSEDVAFRVSAYAGQAIDTFLHHEAQSPGHLSAHAATAAGWALRSNGVVRVEDYARQDRFQRETWPEQECVRSAVNIRVQAHKKPFGVFVAQSETPGQFNATDESFVCIIANLVSQALACARGELHQRRMYDEFRRTRVAREVALSIISHDLRSPATTVKLSLEVLRRSLNAAPASLPLEQIERAIAKSQAGINRMMAMMDELLAMNRAEGDTFHLVREPVDLRAVIDGVLRELDDPIRASKSEVRVEGPGSLVGHWDRVRVEQLVANLLTNALKYGEGKPILLRLERCDSTAHFRVHDQGVGIAAEDQKRIFERFVRIDSSHRSALSDLEKNQRNSNSYGLGLWIVRRVVEALDGSISLQSSPDQGSIFTVELPIGDP